MTSNTMDEMGMNLRLDFFGLRQLVWGTFPFSRELPEGPHRLSPHTVNISAAGFMFTAYLYEVVNPLPYPKQRIFRTQDRTISPMGNHRVWCTPLSGTFLNEPFRHRAYRTRLLVR